MRLSEVGLPLAEALFKGGYSSIEDIAQAVIEDIVSVSELEESKAEEIVDEAIVILAKDEEERLKEKEEESKEKLEEESEEKSEEDPEKDQEI